MLCFLWNQGPRFYTGNVVSCLQDYLCTKSLIQHSFGCYRPWTVFQSSDKVGYGSLSLFFFFPMEVLEFGATCSTVFLTSPAMRRWTLKWKKSEHFKDEGISGEVNFEYRRE